MLKKLCSPGKRWYFGSFLSVSLCFSLARLTFLFTLSLFLSLVIFLRSFFLVFIISPSLFLSFFLALLLWFCFVQRITSRYYILKVVLINIFCFLGFLFCFVFQIPFVIFALSFGSSSTNPALLWCFFSFFFLFFLFWFCVCCFCFIFGLQRMSGKGESLPTIHLAGFGSCCFGG